MAEQNKNQEAILAKLGVWALDLELYEALALMLVSSRELAIQIEIGKKTIIGKWKMGTNQQVFQGLYAFSILACLVEFKSGEALIFY